MTWACAYGLGNVAQTGSGAPYTYTITPINPGITLELPYFSIAEQIAESGGSAVDSLHVGCAIEDFTYQFNYGPGRASSRMTVNWVGYLNGFSNWNSIQRISASRGVTLRPRRSAACRFSRKNRDLYHREQAQKAPNALL